MSRKAFKNNIIIYFNWSSAKYVQKLDYFMKIKGGGEVSRFLILFQFN
jgi:hypothetical protein